MKAIKKFISILIFLALLPSTVSAATLTGNLTVDDAFTVYLSTDDSVAGTPLVSGDYWPLVQTFSTTLIPGNTYYLHISAKDVFGPPSAFLGSFELSGIDFIFANGSQSLVSDSANWGVNTTGFGFSFNSPYDGFGINGVEPWGTMPSIASNAHWIWTGPSGTVGEAYFTTTISPIPEPGIYSMFLAGLGLLGFMVRHKKNLSHHTEQEVKVS